MVQQQRLGIEASFKELPLHDLAVLTRWNRCHFVGAESKHGARETDVNPMPSRARRTDWSVCERSRVTGVTVRILRRAAPGKAQIGDSLHHALASRRKTTYLGIEVDKQHAQVVVTVKPGEVVERVRVENANLDELAQRYAGVQAAVEATNKYDYIRDTLSEQLAVTVAHPKELTQPACSDTKYQSCRHPRANPDSTVELGSRKPRADGQRQGTPPTSAQVTDGG